MAHDLGRPRIYELPGLEERLAHVEQTPARDARYAEPTTEFQPRLRRHLDCLGFKRLYTHQTAAFDLAMSGADLAVVTGTASGKTLCYNLPVLQTLLTNPSAKALYLYPTKALAQDQLRKIQELAPGEDVRCATYDGDTPQSQRSVIRHNAHIVLTNPDMLHMGILPGHENWGKFLRGLRFVVVDEMHAYRGLFGGHVGGILRRLLRLCEWYGGRPQVIACSATIANPAELFEALVGRSCTLVNDDGAPSGERSVFLFRAPEADNAAGFSPNKDTASWVAALTADRVKTMAFCRARITTELVLKSARKELEKRKLDPTVIESYRGGYTPKERRVIEKALFDGKLLGLVSTSAMELGVDVGGLDAVICNGFPGSLASFRQQVGRAGRGGRDGMAVLITHADPLEQYLARRPELLFDATVESVVAGMSNPYVLAGQLRCAAYERALSEEDVAHFGPLAQQVAVAMCDEGELQWSAGRFYYPSHDKPAAQVNIRSIEGGSVLLRCGDQMLGDMERWRALRNAHAGAVYLHRGTTYVVSQLNLTTMVADLTQADVEYFTQPIVQAVLEPTVTIDEASDDSNRWTLSGVTVTTLVQGFKRMALDGSSVLSEELLELPPETMETIAVRLALGEHWSADDPEAVSAVHGMQHALLAIAPVLAGCDRGDLESGWYGFCPETLSPAIYVYDTVRGGCGLAEKLFEVRNSWLSRAMELLSSCGCEEGCPACLLSSRCESGNTFLSKKGALKLFSAALKITES